MGKKWVEAESLKELDSTSNISGIIASDKSATNEPIESLHYALSGFVKMCEHRSGQYGIMESTSMIQRNVKVGT